jgi:phosphatidylglycerol:prolipoprotein diacylglycerol transferase
VINVTPDPVAIQAGPITISWYSLGYAAALAVAALITPREAARRGLDPRHFGQGLFLVVVLGVVGARLYHVVDQWSYYSQEPLRIILPPYSGLGLYGGVAGGMLGLLIYLRRHGQPFLRWADAIVPALLLGQSIARWGNFANQELYGRPTDLPWGIAIECEYRVITPTVDYSCPRLPFETTGFHPLFFYESALTFIGALLALWLGRRFAHRLRDGDLVALWFIWYGGVRTILEPLREGYNWTFFGLPVAILVSVAAVGAGVLLLLSRGRRGSPEPPPAPSPDDGTAPSGVPARPVPVGGAPAAVAVDERPEDSASGR